MEYRTFGRPSADHPMTTTPVVEDIPAVEETPVVAAADEAVEPEVA